MVSRLAVFGSPGAGKGTQAALLSEKLAVPHISTGDLFRFNIENQTKLGLQAQKYLDVGELVPSEITNKMVQERLELADAKAGFILDGYPRSLEQAEYLTQILQNSPLEAAIYFDITPEIVLERMLLRGRKDDDAEVIERRLAVYSEQTLPILNFYEDILVSVQADGTVEEVFERICNALGV